MFLWRLLMADEIPAGDKAVFAFLELFALAFAFEGAGSLLRGEPFWRVIGAWVLTAIFFVAGIKWPSLRKRFGTPGNDPRIWLAVGALAGIIIGTTGTTVASRLLGFYERHKTPKIEPLFSDLYKSNSATLGPPITDPVITNETYEGVHEHAVILWIKTLSEFRRLGNDSKEYTIQPDPIQQMDPTWYRDTDLRLKFPECQKPPIGGVAFHWSNSPGSWQWIGCRVWDCKFYDYSTRYQAFTNGDVIGPLRYNDKALGAQAFVFLKNGTWFSRELHAETPQCAASH